MPETLMKLTRLIAAALTLTACQKAETPEQAAARIEQESAAARTAIDARNAAFEAHFMAGHADSVAAFYAEDGEILPPNDKAVSGAPTSRHVCGFLGQGLRRRLTTAVVAARGRRAR
jgi:hypothetical protein